MHFRTRRLLSETLGTILKDIFSLLVDNQEMKIFSLAIESPPGSCVGQKLFSQRLIEKFICITLDEIYDFKKSF